MQTRRPSVPVLYGLISGRGAAARWLETVAATLDEAAAALCRSHWQYAPRVVPVRARSAPPGLG